MEYREQINRAGIAVRGIDIRLECHISADIGRIYRMAADRTAKSHLDHTKWPNLHSRYALDLGHIEE